VTRAETLSAALGATLAFIALIGYLLDAIGLGIAPITIVALAAAAAIALVVLSPRGNAASGADAVIWAAVVALVCAALVRLGWPSLLLPGGGPDLAHHLLLVDYIEQHGALVHDRSLDGSMGEMAHYTPGSHLLAVVLGAVAGVDGFRAFFPLLAVAAALTAGFVLLIARRLQLPMPYAIGAVLLLFLPAQYFYGAFTHDSFLAQTIATFFAIAAWWALVVWDQQRRTSAAVVFSVFAAATFISWPVFVGPLVLMWVAAAAARMNIRDLVRNFVIAFAPMAVIASLHIAGRLGWVGIVRASGAVLHPSLASVGWLLPLLALLGLATSVRKRHARTSAVLLLAIVLQAAVLFAIAKAQGAHTPYMAFKMVYLAIYPMAVLGALALSSVRRVIGERDVVAWAIATVLLLTAVRPSLISQPPVPIVNRDLYDAGKWARANIAPSCVDYLVGDAETAYWLHLAVLGNPRASARMQEMDVYDPRAAMGTWITTDGRSFAVADLRLLPDEVRSVVDLVRPFGSAAVIGRRGVKMGDCDLGR